MTTIDTRTARATIDASADALLDATVSTFRTGEHGHRDALLEAGRLAHRYVLARLAEAGTRKARPAAILAITARLTAIAGRKVDANRLIRTAQAVDILAEGIDYGTVSYSVLRELAPLVRRDRASDAWGIDPDVDPEDARALFRHVATNHLDRDATAALVGELLDPGQDADEPHARKGEDDGDPAAGAALLISRADAPDDVLQGVLETLAQDAELSGRARRAVQAALVILKRREPALAAV